jgi:hypothetical protein
MLHCLPRGREMAGSGVQQVEGRNVSSSIIHKTCHMYILLGAVL